MHKQIINLWKHDSEYYFDDLVRDIKSSKYIASVTLIDSHKTRVESHIESRRYRVYLEHFVTPSKKLRHKLMQELQVAVSPTHKKYEWEIIGVYRDY